MAFIFGGLFGQDVPLEGLAAFDGSTRTDAKALFSAAFGFHFGHEDAPVDCAREALRT
jgi:hypothetical protein